MYTTANPSPAEQCVSIQYQLPLQRVDFALSMMQETERMHGARCLDRRVLRATGGSHCDVCQ